MSSLTSAAKSELYELGHLRLRQALPQDVMVRILSAAQRLREQYPNGFDHSSGFGADEMIPRASYPTPTDRAPTVVYHNAGFIEPDLLLPLQDEYIYNTIADIVGRDFYLSNVWLQVVPSGTGRMGYHKDEHGSVSITMPLDNIGWDMGSTCVVPGTHRNTPPPNFCMPDILKEHPREVHLSGEPGDVVIFTPETWHGRAPNKGNLATCRLFFNFYSRSSRQSTRWSSSISPTVASKVAERFPKSARHMFRIDPAPMPEVIPSRFEKWVKADGSSSASPTFSGLLREYFYWRYALRTPLPVDVRDVDLPPFRTTITTSGNLSLGAYLRHLNAKRTAKVLARTLVDAARTRLSRHAT